MGHECLSEGDIEEALSSDSDTALHLVSMIIRWELHRPRVLDDLSQRQGVL